jgi:hypothetical protein
MHFSGKIKKKTSLLSGFLSKSETHHHGKKFKSRKKKEFLNIKSRKQIKSISTFKCGF